MMYSIYMREIEGCAHTCDYFFGLFLSPTPSTPTCLSVALENFYRLAQHPWSNRICFFSLCISHD
jgi:hypothetical protein